VLRGGFNRGNSSGNPAITPLRGDAASLTDTMKFIQDKLPGKVNYMVYGHDNITGTDGRILRSLVVTNVSADAGRCYIGFRSTFDNGKAITEKDGASSSRFKRSRLCRWMQ
jgi:hypothetical protein